MKIQSGSSVEARRVEARRVEVQDCCDKMSTVCAIVICSLAITYLIILSIMLAFH